MGQPFIGEIRIFAGSFAPAGWAFCNGQLMPISENDALFTLIGTTYGGDGQETFALPDLQGRLPLHQGQGSFGTTYLMGEKAGVEQVTLTTSQIPAHTHPLVATTAAGAAASPLNAVLAASGSSNVYRPGPGAAALSNQAVSAAGGSQPHTNMQPYLCVDFIISLFGIFPTQT
jgi:microcystin-dependent protein